MKQDIFNAKMAEAGDAYVYYLSAVSNKHKYHICTIELDSCEYILSKLSQRIEMPEPKEGFVRAFCWDLDNFRNIEVSSVTSIVPLSSVVNKSNNDRF